MGKALLERIDIEELIQHYYAGKSTTDLTKLYKCSKWAIDNAKSILQKAGRIQFRGQPPAGAGILGRIPDFTKGKALKKQINEMYNIDWEIKTSTRMADKDKGFTVGMLVADAHNPEIHLPSFNIALQVAEDINPDIFIDLGDICDYKSISPHVRRNGQVKQMSEITLQLENDAVNKYLDCWGARLSKECVKELFDSNHTAWVKKFLEKNPSLQCDALDPIKAWHLKERGFKFHGRNKIVKRGKVSYCHGDLQYSSSSAYPALTLMQKYVHHNFICGHFHILQRILSARAMDKQPYEGCVIPALCKRGQDYTECRPAPVVNGFALIYYLSNGTFFLQPHVVKEKKCIVNGKLYKG